MVAPGHDSYLLPQLEITEHSLNDDQVRAKQEPIRTCYLGHVTGHQPIRDQYSLFRSVHAPYRVIERREVMMLELITHVIVNTVYAI